MNEQAASGDDGLDRSAVDVLWGMKANFQRTTDEQTH